MERAIIRIVIEEITDEEFIKLKKGVKKLVGEREKVLVEISLQSLPSPPKPES